MDLSTKFVLARYTSPTKGVTGPLLRKAQDTVGEHGVGGLGRNGSGPPNAVKLCA